MKNLSLVLNGLLIVAVAVLYYKHYNTNHPVEATTVSAGDIPVDHKVAYINADSVLVNYKYFDEIQSELKTTGAKLEKEYQSRAEGLQREVNDYQRSVNNLTIGQAKALEEDLLKKQQNLRMYQENLSQQLLKEESRLNQALYEKVTAFLKEYSERNDIDMVVKYNQGSDVLYANGSMDITKAVIDGLNTIYDAGDAEVADVVSETDTTSAN